MVLVHHLSLNQGNHSIASTESEKAYYKESIEDCKENHIFIPASDVQGVTIKKFALLNSKTKRIEIDTADGKSHKLYANVEESDFPYHKENFAKFMAKYGY